MIELRPVDRDSQETIINMLAIDGYATVYTNERKMVRRLEKLHEQNPNTVELVYADSYGVKYLMPKKWVKLRPPRKVNLSEEALQKLRENAKRVNFGRNNKQDL